MVVDVQKRPSLPDQGFKFDPAVAPPNSRWVPPRWMVKHESAPGTPKHPNVNGLEEPWDPRRPVFRGRDLTKPDPRLKVPNIEIKCDTEKSVIAFVDVNIIDSTGAEPYLGDVLVKGQRIASVGDKLSHDELVASGARIIQGNGRTLMSGLVDAHTHFTWTNAGSLDGLGTMPVEEHTLFSTKSAKTFLDCGYTMCLGAASAKQRIDQVVRNAIQAGDIPGPRFLANGKEMAPQGGALVPEITRFVASAADIEAAVNEMADAGIDQVKFSMSGEEITEHLRAEDTTFPDDMVAAGVEAAHAKGIRVCSHARSDEAIVQCLQYGVDIIYHASFISDSTMLALDVQKDRVFVAPALNWLVSTLNDAEAFGYPIAKAESVGYARELEVAISGLKEMHRRGIKILPGGDYGFAWTPHGTYRDLEHFVNLLDFTPMEAIISATAFGGEIMLHPHELGKVLPGYYADLILVDGNPLEDISILTNHQNLDVILINGQVHKEHPKDRQVYNEANKPL